MMSRVSMCMVLGVRSILSENGPVSMLTKSCCEYEQLCVNLPPEERCEGDNVRAKIAQPPNVILQPMLTYIHFAMQSGTIDAIRKATVNFFPGEAISEAKQVEPC